MLNIHEMPSIKGRIWVLGDSIDTDLIVPSRVLTEQDTKKQLAATLENLKPNFARDVKEGDMILAGKNFGCGSSREEAVFVLKQLGIKAIIAVSFARIFYRNCINLGLPPIILQPTLAKKSKKAKIPEQNIAASLGEEGDIVEIDFSAHKLTNLKNQHQMDFEAFSPFIEIILSAGGALALLKEK